MKTRTHKRSVENARSSNPGCKRCYPQFQKRQGNQAHLLGKLNQTIQALAI